MKNYIDRDDVWTFSQGFQNFNLFCLKLIWEIDKRIIEPFILKMNELCINEP